MGIINVLLPNYFCKHPFSEYYQVKTDKCITCRTRPEAPSFNY